MSKRGRKKKGEEEVTEPKRKRARRKSKKEEEVIEPFEGRIEPLEEEGKKWYTISLDFLRVLYSPVGAFQRIAEKPDIKGIILIFALTLLVTVGSTYAQVRALNIGIPVLQNVAEMIPTVGPPYNLTQCFISPSEPRRITICTNNWTNGSDTVTIHGEKATGQIDKEEVVIALNGTFYKTSKYFRTVTKVEFSRGGNDKDQYVILGTEGPEEYIPAIASSLFIPNLTNGLMSSAFSFFIHWFIYAGVFWLVLKVFREEIESMGAFFIIMGYFFITGVIEKIAYTFFFFALPTISLPLAAWTGVDSELYDRIVQENWGATWSYQALRYIPWPWVFQVWAALLSVVAVHFLFKITWRKAAIIAVVANVANFLIRTFII